MSESTATKAYAMMLLGIAAAWLVAMIFIFMLFAGLLPMGGLVIGYEGPLSFGAWMLVVAALAGVFSFTILSAIMRGQQFGVT